ncbi:PAS fold [Trypanosoma melophagium]|uniref:PAS fold n=1 Tax=Trypanosoma melophagium TaxID=715481 RepID=UPI00351A59E6|nr:PAS fold [Trypanosoma melophagium]
MEEISYIQQHGITELMAQLTDELREQKPANHVAFMLQWLKNMAEGGDKSGDGACANIPITTTSNNNNTNITIIMSTAGINNNTIITTVEEDGANNNNIGLGDDDVDTPELAVFVPVRDLLFDNTNIDNNNDNNINIMNNANTPAVSTRAHRTAVSPPLLNTNAWDHSERSREALTLDYSVKTRGSSNEMPLDALLLRLPPTAAARPLLEVVMRLPSEKHAMALAFLEELLQLDNSSESENESDGDGSNNNDDNENENENNNDNNKNKNKSGEKRGRRDRRDTAGVWTLSHISSSQSPFVKQLDASMGATFNRESNGMTASEVHGRSSVSARSFDAMIAARATPLANTAQIQEVVNDALTASIVGRDFGSRDGLEATLHSAFTAKTGSSAFTVQTADLLLAGSARPLTLYSSNREDCGVAVSSSVPGTPHSTYSSDQAARNAAWRSHHSSYDDKSYKALLCNDTETAREEELNAVREALVAYGPFSGLDETQLEGIIRSMERHELHSSQVRKNSSALFFVCSGNIQVEKEGRVLRLLSAGDFFGKVEMAQEEGELEGVVDIRALADGVILSIRTNVFHSLINDEKKARRSMFLKFIKYSDILSPLSSRHHRRLADSLRVRNIKAGTVLLQQGNSVEWFSLVISGTIRRVIRDETDLKEGGSNLSDSPDPSLYIKNTNELLEITSGGILGEVEFLFHSDALTDAVAETNVLIAQLHFVYFQTIIPQQVIEEMKRMIAITPIASFLAPRAKEKIRREIEQVAKSQNEAQEKTCEAGLIRKRNSNASGTSTQSSSKRGSPGTRMTIRMGKKQLRSAGEIVYAGKHNVYRFPLCAIDIVNTIMIAVVADGTIIRWSAAADRVTGFRHYHVIGQSIYELLTTESARCNMREHLQQAHSFAGNWDSYVAAGFSSPFVYRFRQASALYHVSLLLSVIPSCVETSADVMLLVGRESDSKTASSFMEDASRWISDVLRPQLRLFQKRVEAFEARDWNLSQQDGKWLCGHVQACNSLVERYLRLSSLNMEAMNETWKPVRILNLVRQFSRDVTHIVKNAGNTLKTTVLEDVPKHEFFIDVDNALEVLRRIVCDANNSGSPVHIAITVSVARATSLSPSAGTIGGTTCVTGNKTHATDMIRRASFASPAALSAFDVRRRASLIPPPGAAAQLSAISQCAAALNATGGTPNFGTTPPAKENVWLCNGAQHRQVIDGSAPSLMQHIHITLVCTAGESNATPNKSNNSETPAKHSTRNFAGIKECDRLVTNMGGNLTVHTSLASSQTTTTIVLDLPLLPVPWFGNDENEDENDVAFHGSSLTVIVADRDSKQRNALCELMWARRHVVAPVTSYTEAMLKIKGGGADILVIDPVQLECTEEETEAFKNGHPPFDALQREVNLVLLLYTNDFNDWRVQKFMERCHVVELPKPAYGALLHFAMQEAEHVVALLREDEEQIAQLRMAFTEFQPERHKVGRMLGKGAFGEVHEVEDLLTGGKLAMKRMHLTDGVLADDVVQELLAMTSLRHENIIHYFGCQKESDNVLRLYMELASAGNLQEKIRRYGGPLPLDAIVQHLQDLCRGLAYLHAENYVHGDIKTANALIDHHGRTKIGDFGTAKRLRGPSNKLYTFVGTPQFMAPELMNVDATQGNGYNQKADIWSLGCIALELATGMAPFSYLEHTRGMGIFFYVGRLTGTPDLSPIEDGDPLVYSFIASCLNADPELRPEAKELLTHKLLQTADASTRKERLARHVKMAETLREYAPDPSESDEDGMRSNMSSYNCSENSFRTRHASAINADFVFGDRNVIEEEEEEDQSSNSSDGKEDEWTSVEDMRRKLKSEREFFFSPRDFP